MDTIINATKTRPWLWAVYVAVVLLPIMIIIGIYCWLREPNTRKTHYRIKKKNDDYTEDEDDDDDNYEEAMENDKPNIKSKTSGKEVLEKPLTKHRSRRRVRKE